MKIQSKLLILSFRDMIDFQAVKVNKFRKLNIKFCLKECLDEVIQMMRFKAHASNIKINFTPEFQSEDERHNFVSIVEHQRLSETLLKANSHIDKHPLFKLVSQLDRNTKLPTHCMGDPDRLQQVAINLIQNAINS